jgi:GntR family transcriptional regulator
MTTLDLTDDAAAYAPPAPRRRELPAGLGALDPGGEAPLHLQLRGALIEAVAAAGLAHGDRIWSENQLMRHYTVSRHVVRQALNQLVLEGRLSVRKGAGYFVNRRRVVKNLRTVSGITSELAASGEPYSVELLDVGTGPAEDDLEKELAGPSGRVHRVRRIGRLDGEPVALLDGAYATALRRVLTAAAVNRGGVYQVLAGHGLPPSHADVALSVGFAGAEDRLLLEVAEGTPVVCVRARMRTASGKLIEVTRELYRSDRFEFSYAAEAAP